jgi:hypothetical protein
MVGGVNDAGSEWPLEAGAVKGRVSKGCAAGGPTGAAGGTDGARTPIAGDGYGCEPIENGGTCGVCDGVVAPGSPAVAPGGPDTTVGSTFDGIGGAPAALAEGIVGIAESGTVSPFLEFDGGALCRCAISTAGIGTVPLLAVRTLLGMLPETWN